MNRPLAPKFLRQLDEKLLKNKPELYSTRLLWVAYYGLLTIITLGLVFWALPNDPRSNSPVASWVGMTIIVCLLALVFWLIYLLRFNVFKRFGNITAWGRLAVFASFFACTFIIVFFAYVPPIVETAKANLAYKEKELIDDINYINRSICLLERDSLDKKWGKDTVFVTTDPSAFIDNDSLLVRVIEKDDDGEVVITKKHKTPYGIFEQYDIETWESFYSNNLDSVIKLKDSLFIKLYCPTYRFVEKSYGGEINAGIATNKYLFHNYVNTNFKVDGENILNNLKPKLQKYSLIDGEEIYNKNVSTIYSSEDTSYRFRLQRRYITSIIEDNIENIAKRKYRWDGIKDEVFRSLFYISFSIALLIFVFRHTTTKTFFISLLTGIILAILTSILLAFIRYGESEILLWVMLGYLILFTIFSSLIFQENVRKIFYGIALNLFTLSIYGLPLLLVGIAYESFIYEPPYDSPLRVYYEINKDRAFVIAEFACPILFCILLVTFIHKAYKKWYALAEE